MQTKEIKVDLDAGFSLYLPNDDKVSTPIMYHSKKWENTETEILKKVIKPGDIVVDVGAYVGYYTILLSQLVGPKGKVYAFEPEPENFALLDKNTAMNTAMPVVYQAAVGDSTGSDKLYIDVDNKGDHRLYDSKDGRDVIIVSKVKLDDLIKPPINFLKLDVQGSETLAIRGAEKLIVHSPNLKILMEFWPYGLYKCCKDDGTEVLTFLEKNGFHFYIMEEEGIPPHVVSKGDLLGAFKPNVDKFVNLFCTRGSL